MFLVTQFDLTYSHPARIRDRTKFTNNLTDTTILDTIDPRDIDVDLPTIKMRRRPRSMSQLTHHLIQHGSLTADEQNS